MAEIGTTDIVLSGRIIHTQPIVIKIHIYGQTGSQTVVIIHFTDTFKIALPHGVDVRIPLMCPSVTQTVQVIEVMVTECSDDGNGGTAFGIIDISVFYVSVYAPGVEVDAVGISNRIG